MKRNFAKIFIGCLPFLILIGCATNAPENNKVKPDLRPQEVAWNEVGEKGGFIDAHNHLIGIYALRTCGLVQHRTAHPPTLF
jgi:hypothetical protein